MPTIAKTAPKNGENLKLAQRLAEQAKALGQTADVLDLTTLELPVFTPRAQAKGTPLPYQHSSSN